MRNEALKGNARLEVKRARFSNIERAYVFLVSGIVTYADLHRHVLQAAKNPVDLDERQVSAVAARIELDLRIGYAFTRYLTNKLKPVLGGSLAAGPEGKSRVISYGEQI